MIDLNNLYGFKLVKRTEIKDIDCVLYELHHDASGANLCYLESEDTNKCFMAGFKTLPSDSTGVCHIIEHSTLCGSDKYPLKEPFVNLLKGSMATFLNAMTASDWTAYPVASQNDKDFDNLMSVYLDAVFSPLSIKDNKPFLQEGWHLELESEDGIPSYKGVVYNEMKGAMSSVEEQLSQESLNTIYKGTGYGVNSGGEPEVIPTLTYEYYKDFYKKHYVPENCLLFLYGKMDLSSKLKFISEEYLSRYSYTGLSEKIPVPEPLISENCSKVYGISSEESLEDNYYVSVTYGLDNYANMKDSLGINVLLDSLMGSNDSPVKKALMDEHLGADISYSYDDDCIRPCVMFQLIKGKENSKEAFFNALKKAFKDIAEKGIDKNLLTATINHMEFRSKEKDMGRTPKGLIYGLSLLPAYLYDLPYEDCLEETKYFDFLKENLNTGYFEGLIEKYFLNSDFYTVVELIPSKTYNDEKEQEMNEKMKALKASMTPEEIKALVKQTKDLIAYQSKVDTIEELKTLPKLTLDEIDTNVNSVPTKVVNKEYTLYDHDISTNGISYLKMYFDLSMLTLDELQAANILSTLYTNLDTVKYNAVDLQNYSMTYLGNAEFSVSSSKVSKGGYKAIMNVSLSALDENNGYMKEFLNEVLFNQIYDKEKINQILVQSLTGLKESIMRDGMTVATIYAIGKVDESTALKANLMGPSMYEYLKNALNDVDSLIEKFKSVTGKIYGFKNLTVSVSGNRKEELESIVNSLPLNHNEKENNLKADLLPDEDEALIIPSEVSYNGLGAKLSSLGYEYNGSLNVLSHIMRYDYLWSEVRVKGGAYGCTVSFGALTGTLMLGSYRDPNVERTYDAFMSADKYLESFNPTEDEYMTYLIGAMGAFDKPGSCNYEISNTDLNYIANISAEDRIKVKKEMLRTKIEDIKAYKDMFKKLKDTGKKYTVGNETKINAYSPITLKNNL